MTSVKIRTASRGLATSLACSVALATLLSGCAPTLFQEVLITAVIHQTKRPRQAQTNPDPPAVSATRRAVPQVPSESTQAPPPAQ